MDEYDFYSTTPSSKTESSVQSLDPIPYMPSNFRHTSPCTSRRKETRRVVEEIQEVLSDVRASAFLVTWPLSSLTGKPGKDCGKVLHVLDAMAELDHPIITKNKPCMLWDTNRGERLSLLCSAHEKKTMLNPIKNWLLTEKLVRKNLELQKQNNAENMTFAKTRDVSETARSALQEFMDLNWPKHQREDTPDQIRQAEELLFQNHLLNGSFDNMEDPQTAQMRLLI